MFVKMAKAKTDDRQRDNRTKPNDKKRRIPSRIKRRRPINWDDRQDCILVLAVLRQSFVDPDFKKVANEMGFDMFSPDMCRKRYKVLDDQATAIFKDRKMRMSGQISMLEPEAYVEEKSEAESEKSYEPSSPRPTTPLSSTRQIGKDRKMRMSRDMSKQTEVSPEGRQMRTYGSRDHQQRSQTDHVLPEVVRYDTPETNSSNKDTDCPSSAASNETYSTRSLESIEELESVQIPTPWSKNARRNSRERNSERRSHESNRTYRKPRSQQPQRKQPHRNQHSSPCQDSGSRRGRDNYRPSRSRGRQQTNTRYQINNGLVHQHFRLPVGACSD